MKKIIIYIFISFGIILSSSLKAQIVSEEEALIVAKNWVTLISQKEKGWGGSKNALVEDIQEFRLGKRQLGFYCSVQPRGFIIISRHRALAPIKAYSTTNNLDYKSDVGAAGLLKESMERILVGIEKQIAPIEFASVETLQSMLEINYSYSWDELGNEGGVPVEMNYQTGEVMLSTHWNQGPPFNNQCPVMGCDNSNSRALVGCTGAAGAQLTRYWCWPPYGEDGSPFTDPYDWPRMINQYIWNSTTNTWEDENKNTLTQAHIDAVAELCAEMGEAVGMDYGCDASSSPICRWYETDMTDALEDHFRYHTGDCEDRNDYSAVEWFELLKNEFNANRPVLYHVTNHSIVADGWREVGSTPIRQYHMNYGWYPANNIWYTLDAIPLGDVDEEYALLNIHPLQALGPSLSGNYALEPFAYRYFNQDATGNNATFEAGQYLQFLPGIAVSADSDGFIRFEGSEAKYTHLFINGDISKGMRIMNGMIKISNHGSIAFPK